MSPIIRFSNNNNMSLCSDQQGWDMQRLGLQPQVEAWGGGYTITVSIHWRVLHGGSTPTPHHHLTLPNAATLPAPPHTHIPHIASLLACPSPAPAGSRRCPPFSTSDETVWRSRRPPWLQKSGRLGRNASACVCVRVSVCVWGG